MSFKDLIKLIWNYLKPYRKTVYGCLALATFASAVSAVIPVVYGRLVDEATTSGVNMKIIGLILLAWLVFVTLANWMSRYVNLKGEQLGGLVCAAFIRDVYAHYIRLPLDFHKDKRSGEQMNKISRAGDYIWDMISRDLFYLFPSFLTAVIAVSLMYSIEWRMSSFVAVILVAYGFATIIKTKPIVKSQRMINKAWEKTWGQIYDTIGNIEIVKTHVSENREIKNVAGYLFGTIEKMISFFKKWRDLAAWQDNIQGVGFVLVFSLALYFLLIGQITPGVLVTFVGYVNLVFRPFNQLGQSYRQFQRALVTIKRAVKLQNIKTETYQTGKTLADVLGTVEFQQVNFTYGQKNKQVLYDLSFKTKAGEVVALVGESGGGKSTTLRLISKYYSPKKGKILLDGEDISKLDLSFLRSQIAVVPQEVTLFNDTIKMNLAYAKPGVRDQEIIAALKSANAWEFVDSFPKKLKQIVGERGVKLSTGQKQRIAIARAILRDPKILILDEATSALDSVSERLVQEALKKLIAGRTTFIIAHRLSTITHADNILVFNKGRLVEQGKHDDLIKKEGVYWRLYKEQKF